MSYKGIDISTWQQNVDYNKLKSQGIEFAIIRCGYGKYLSQKDTMFERHYEGLKNAGIKIGVYLYSYVTSIDNALLEAQNCLKIIEGKTFELPVFYDLEDRITKYLGKETITECAKVFCREIEKTGRKAGVYANLDWFTNYINVNELINSGFKIWLAQWNNQITANFKVDYWQYTSRGHIDGIPDVVDLNYCYDDISKTVDNVEKPVEKSRFEIGQTYTLQVDLNVRTGAGTSFSNKKYQDLTNDGKNHAYKQSTAVLKKGTRVTCMQVINNGSDIWLKIPSGYVAGYYQGKEYIK